MIKVVYPEWVQIQLDILDEHISNIYENAMLEFEKTVITYEDALRLERETHERIRPFVNEKCRLIQNCCPKYIIRKEQ